MTIKKCILSLAVAVAALSPTFAARAETQSFTIIGRGSTGATSDLAFTVLEEALKRTFPDDNVQIRRLPGTSAATPPRLQSNEAQFGHGVGESVLDAWTGTRTSEGREPMRDLRYLGAYLGWLLRPAANPTFVTTAGSGIKTWADLSNKRVGVGPPDSLTSTMVEVGLAGVGLSYEKITANRGLVATGDWNQQLEMLGDGQLDAVFVSSDHPSPMITQFAANNDPYLANMEAPVLAELIANYPTFAEDVIPAGTYDWQEQDVLGTKVSSGFVVHKDLPEETVYQVCKHLYVGDSAKIWGEVAPNWAGAEKMASRAASTVFIPLHPGAKRCFEEAGIEITYIGAGNDTP